MPKHIVERLFASFSELEQAITGAKTTLGSKAAVPQAVLDRLNSYDAILGKQRGLARKLCDHMSSGNWNEVSRHVNLINGLSAMIRDDARAILSSLALNSDSAQTEGEVNFC